MLLMSAVIPLFFLDIDRAFCLGTVVLLLCRRGRLWIFYQLLVFSKVILWVPFFLLVLLEYLSVHPSPDGLLYQPWYFDDGALVFFSATLASFLDVLQHDAHGFGVCPNLSNTRFSGQQLQVINFFRVPSSVKCVPFSDSGQISKLCMSGSY